MSITGRECDYFALDCPLIIFLSLQEDKEAMFDTYDTVYAVLQVATGVISTLKVRDGLY